MHSPESLLTALTAMGIAYENHHHAAVFTVEESMRLDRDLQGAHIKNLFVKDKARTLYLITALQSRSLSLKALGKHLGAKDNLSFADEATLLATLGITPGSVSPLALINAAPGSLRFILDSGAAEQETILPHPLINTQTTALKTADLLRAIKSWGHQTELIDLGLFPREEKAA